MAEIMLAAQGVAKVYGGRTLLRDVSLDIARGEAVALLGHNGSGKTTLLRILAGLTNPSAGRVDRARCRSIGYVPENFPRMGITAGEYCLHMARIEGLNMAEAQKRRAALFADFFMEQMLDTPMRHLSKGSLQKVGVIQALLMEHDVLLLDEPLSGQDADSQRVFIGKMLACKARGTSLLLSCHEPFLVRRLADRAFRIHDAGLHASIVEAAGAESATMVLTRAGGTAERPDFAPAVRWHEKEGRLTITAPAEGAQALLLDMLTRGWRLEEMRHEKDA